MKQETGKDKIQKICDALRKDTLEPAKQEAREILENAQIQAAQMHRDAAQRAEALVQKARSETEEMRRVFEASLQLACRQGIEMLKQKIEQELFSPELVKLVRETTADPKMIAHILNAFMQSMQDKGVEEDFIALIPKHISARMINEMLAKKVLERLDNNSVALGDFQGGAQVRLKGSHITIDMSDQVVRELIARYIRRDFRDFVFSV